MKKYIILLVAIMITTVSFGASESTERLDKKTIKSMTEEQRQDRVDFLEQRVLVIEDANFESMARSDKRALKKELRNIDREMHALDGSGIYISTGAIIIILLLIIIL